MKNNKYNRFSVGKLSHKFLGDLIEHFVSDLGILDKRIIMGSKIGEDAAVIDIPGENYLVVKTDPITFTTNQIGYYVVNVNVNDIVCTGATPKWFQTTILLPEKGTNKKLIQSIFQDIHDTCRSLDIVVIGGHTEVTGGIKRPIIIGNLIGEVKKENLVNTSGAEPGDNLILTKGIFIEGTSIIAREKEDLLRKKGYKSEFIQKCKNYLFEPGISVYKEALLANQNFTIKAMHDPTEGGLACGVAEMAIASDTGIFINMENINILSEPKKLSQIFDLNPLGTISSGSLLIAIEREKDADKLINLLQKNEIYAVKIGEFQEKENGLQIKKENGKIETLYYSEKDEIAKIF
ncbi:MAG: Hydrogenase expression/formation protein [Promethearchaeota archaeon]|jgi:hydrogenase maturation factor|nr:MAG: Hydrogenase expression/formation protein [Candidatus Lokiarchaeota archaeon]